MPENITLESIKPCEGDMFTLKLKNGSELELMLTEVKSGRKLSEDHECFSLLFQDEARSSLHQRIYELDHTEMGTFSLFLVPVDADEKGHYYEAVFNRIQKK